MTGYAYAAVGVILAGCAVYAADVIFGDRIRIALQVRRFRRALEHDEAFIARLQAELDDAEQRSRDCRGEGGDA